MRACEPTGAWRHVPLSRASLGAIAAIALGACGSSAPVLDTSTVERSIAESIRVQHDLRATVACPTGVARRAGASFTCDASLDVGSYPVLVTQSNDRGAVVYSNSSPLVALNIAKVEQAIARAVRERTHTAASVSCPTEVLQQAGLAFTCSARVKGRTRVFAVTQADGGRVRFIEQS
jgi:hypothetical protein